VGAEIGYLISVPLKRETPQPRLRGLWSVGGDAGVSPQQVTSVRYHGGVGGVKGNLGPGVLPRWPARR
jgi:hypothetical protein